MSEYINSEREKISIYEVNNNKFNGYSVLRIHDDAPSPVVAIHLLDEGTVDYLLDELQKLKVKFKS